MDNTRREKTQQRARSFAGWVKDHPFAATAGSRTRLSEWIGNHPADPVAKQIVSEIPFIVLPVHTPSGDVLAIDPRCAWRRGTLENNSDVPIPPAR